MSETPYELLTSVAKDAINAPYSKTWENNVTKALADMEAHEATEDLPKTSHALLETAILEKLTVRQDMPGDELEAHLRIIGVPIEQGGEIQHKGSMSSESQENSTTSDKTGRFRKDPKAARIIANLIRDHGINPSQDLNIKIIPKAEDSHRHHKEPYWVIGIKPWSSQIAVCNVTHEGTYVGEDIRSKDDWQDYLSNKTRLKNKGYQRENRLIALSAQGVQTLEQQTNRIVNAAKNGVENARINAQVILNCIYHHIAEENKIPGSKDKNLLRPHETLNQYDQALFKGQIQGQPKGTNIPKLLIQDLTDRAKEWRKEKGNLPDEMTDEVIDPDHPSLSKITWKQIGTLIKSSKANSYGFKLSEQWKNAGLTEHDQAQDKRDLNRINAAIRELSDSNSLPSKNTQTNLPENRRWDNEMSYLQRHKGTTLARFWKSTGLKSIEDAYQKPITADDIQETRERFDLLDDDAQTRLLGDLGIKTIKEFCDAIQEGSPSISLLLEDHPVAQAQAASLDAD